ncbi:amino acid deaminase/aldolase [Paenibacillus apiarius]|uniref:amino acid deaminase/aldolase n=1 Tax=Paenibacillus apiarius TaxID=46240 RepID=UPI003B3A42BF
MMKSPHPYEQYTEQFAELQAPLACLNLDLLEQNAQEVLRRAGAKPVRIATKSIRSLEVLRYVLTLSPRFEGIMCYSPWEAAALAQAGFADVLLGYPTVDAAALAEIARFSSRAHRTNDITLMADGLEQLQLAEAIGREKGACFAVCLDIDMSSSLYGIHFGVRRSPLRTVEETLRLAEYVRRSPSLTLRGVMGYEAQMAGVADSVPGAAMMNAFVRHLKRRSGKDIQARRSRIVQALSAEGHELAFVNGGGTGSLGFTAADASVTEVTAGSAFFNPALFDHYAGLKLYPAASFALPVVRVPKQGIYTCFGGGYVASGSAGKDKYPRPIWPEGGVLLPNEGAGEVQTPVKYPAGGSAVSLQSGDWIWFRHAKAGELCERFRELHVVQGGVRLGTWATYRGEGWCFG